MDLLRSGPPAAVDCRLCLHLSCNRTEPGRRESGRRASHPGQHERVGGQRRARRRDGRVLVERPVVDGQPTVLGEGDRKPPIVHDGADEPDGLARRNGRRRDVHDLGTRGLHAGRRRRGVRRGLPGCESIDVAGRLFRHPHRPLRAGDVLRVPVLALGTRGVEPVRPHGGADLLLERLLLPSRWPLSVRRMGFCGRRLGLHHPGGSRPRRTPAAHPRRGGVRGKVLGPHRARGTRDPRGPRGRILDPRKVRPRVSRDTREARWEDDLTASMNTYWRTFKTAAWLGWEMDSNWTEPWLFVIYSIVKPVAGAFILIFM